MSRIQPKVTVSGSFRRAMAAVEEAVYSLTDAGARVLSPADPRVVDQFGDFLFVASDWTREIRVVQSRHLAAIEASDFVWLVAPEGYVGLSGAMEVGYAVAAGTPVYASEVPTDLTLRQYVTTLDSPEAALRAATEAPDARERDTSHNLLLDPHGTIQAAHDDLERIADELRGDRAVAGTAAARAEVSRVSARAARPLHKN